jgi:acyl transferase domain-containing protein
MSSQPQAAKQADGVIAAVDPQHTLEILRRTKAGMQRLSARLSEPLAIIGLGCRFPGAANPEKFWEMLIQGRQVELTSGNRWADSLVATSEKQAGKITANRGGFLENIDRFDASFFGISGREACKLDPQQRLLLEVAWETFEDAGVDPTACRGRQIGTFVGICSNDYLHRMVGQPHETIDTYLSTGNSHGAAAGRLSYFMDWRGPSMAVDTACSSSLTALHLATRSLRYGDCEAALVMGVNVILAPELGISLSQAGMLSPTGRCHSFSASADGFARGEGCGAILMKRLSRAIEDGDRIICLVRGTATGQDGHSNGLTAPNGLAQQQVIQAALADGRLTPADVTYVEAHGTGTPLGDPIEMEALRSVFAGDRPVSLPLGVGSVKSNLGHLEGAAGIAGVIKTALALRHGMIPPHPQFNEPSSHIDWNWPVEIYTRPRAWSPADRPRIAGVSSFGFGGSNVHVVLGESPVRRPRTTPIISRARDCS